MKNIVLSAGVLLLAACASQAQPISTPEKASEPMNTSTSAAANNTDSNREFSATAQPLKQLLRFPREEISAINFYVEDVYLFVNDKGYFWTREKWIEYLRYPGIKNQPAGWRKSEDEWRSGRFGWFRTPAEQWPKILDTLEEVQTSTSRQLHPSGMPSLLIEIQYHHRQPIYILANRTNPNKPYIGGSIHGLTADTCPEPCTSLYPIFFDFEDMRELFNLVDSTYPLFRLL
ncbi:hypothetical protein ABFV80_002079 [Vandammella animalimorsus]|uniref:hypothetical protein n=1 Tax=Vandammella animalimorsus TaxID=2029117 RepID=UPI00325B4455